MIRAELVVTGIGDLATLATGPVPRIGPAMSELGRRNDAALAVDGGRFVFVGSARECRTAVRLRSGGQRWDAEGASVVPGFVDAHTHVLFAGDRHREVALKVRGASYAEIAESGGGLYSTVRATRRASDEALLDATAARLARMASHGTTTVEVKSGYALDHAGELRLLGLVPALARRSGLRLVPTYLGAHAVPPEFRGRADEYVDQMIRRTLPVVARERLSGTCDVFCEPGFFTVAQSERLLRAALSCGLSVRLHADEFVRSGGARLAARLHAASADHLLAATAGDRSALARAGVPAVLLPVTPFASMARGRCPGREMVDAGVAVALGSDLSPNSWVESMPLVLAHAVYAARLTPAEALTAATVNAAHVLGVAESAGTIAVGRSADFSAFRTGAAEEIPYRVGSIPERVYRQGKFVSSR
jgi:imidazolonepropionase